VVNKQIRTIGALRRKWEQLKSDPDFKSDGKPNFLLAIKHEEDGVSCWLTEWDDGNAEDALAAGEPGLYAILDASNERPIMKAQFDEAGARQSPNTSVRRPAVDPNATQARELHKVTEAWERQNISLEAKIDKLETRLEKERDRYDELYKQNLEYQEKILELTVQLADKDGGLEAELPDLVRTAVDAWTGRKVREKITLISNRVLEHFPDEMRGQVAGLVAQETERLLAESTQEN
jgi:hypothetical protein